MTADLPFFSIIIPTYNRPERLRACLSGIAQVDYPHDHFDVIIVDDGSPQPLDSVIAPFQKVLEITLMRQPNSGPARARNAGLALAKGALIAFLDDDCTPAQDWLRNLAARCVEFPECMIGGHTLNALPQNLCSTASQLIADVVYRYYNADPEDARFITSNNMLVPAQTLRVIGLFDASFSTSAAEDRELCDRWRHTGHRIVYVPEVLIYHAHAMSLRGYLRQHFNYGRGACHFHRKRAARGVNSFAPEVGFHRRIGNWLLYPISQVRSWRKPLMFGLIIAWQAANTLGYFYELFRSQERFQRRRLGIER